MDLQNFMHSFGLRLNDIEEVLTGNRIFKERLVNIGLVSHNVIVIIVSLVLWQEDQVFLSILELLLLMRFILNCHFKYQWYCW